MNDDKSVRTGAGESEAALNSAAKTANEATARADAAANPEAAVEDSKGDAAETAPMSRETGPAEPDGDRADAGAARSPSAFGGTRPLIAALVAAAVLLLGAVGVAGYLYVQERDRSTTLAAYEEARQAACRYAPVLANYDAKNLDPYFSAVTAGATGDWKKEFETTTAELREALVAGQVVSTAGDIQCAVKSADATSAETVVVIGQTISSLGTRGQPAPGQLSMVMRMQKVDGAWLVDQMITPLAPRAAP